MSKFKATLITIALLAAVVIALMQHSQLSSLREDNQSLHQQVDQLAAETERLTNSPAQSSIALPKDQMSDLLKLRGEVTALRKQTNELARVRTENAQLRSSLASARQSSKPNEAEPPDEQRMQAMSRLSDARTYVLGLLMHAADNEDRFATNLDQVARYLRKDYATTNQFELVYQGSRQGVTNVSSIILLREQQPRQQPDGGWTKTYGFLDGHSEIHREPDGNFDTYEREHIVVSPVATPTGQ